MAADTPPAPRAIADLPSWLLGRAAARGRGLVAAALAEEGLRMWHHAVLAAVAERGPVAQAALGRSLAIDPKDMVGVLNDLQAGGLVSREPDPTDRRKNAITVTPDGRHLLDRCRRLADRANDELLAPLDPAERTRFLALLRRVAFEPDVTGTEAGPDSVGGITSPTAPR
ncbi:MarR family winged helix-turn-helix transcriptional regulator [Streptomyces sp. NPDC053431]|uniref:MarR family winged helix-turn-helix transcriptional regulator n=1 Tax=Streptomyces sp. NPDC053431 TaxID=3365703 RepID=UPI0037D5BCFF